MSVGGGEKSTIVSSLGRVEKGLQKVQEAAKAQDDGWGEILRLIIEMRDRQQVHIKSIK